MTPQQIKDFADAQWQSKGVRNAANGNVFQEENGCVRIKAGHTWQYTSKETKRRQKGLAMYNPKLKDIILAEATREMRDQKVEKPRKAWEDPKFETKPMPHYTWPKATKEPEPAKTRRKRVSRAQAEQAAAILAKVPENELTAFLARFGLSLTTCAALASIGDVEAMAREFLRAVA
jgi:hypothetical protein